MVLDAPVKAATSRNVPPRSTLGRAALVGRGDGGPRARPPTMPGARIRGKSDQD